MERWVTRRSKHCEVPKIDAFLADVAAVCRQHKLSIAHEDGHGAFVVENYDDGNIEWLNDAHDGR